MILSVCVKLNEIFEQGRNFHWNRPECCPRCGSVRLWGHGYVAAYFDGFSQGLWLRRFRCPDCKCVIRMKPEGYFPRFQASNHTIRSCLKRRLSAGKWDPGISKSRQRHWLLALKRRAMAFFGVCQDLLATFDRMVEKGLVPVSRSI